MFRFILLFAICNVVYIQNYISAQVILDYNNVSASVSSTGNLFYNNASEDHYIIPKENGTRAIFSLNFMIGAKDELDSLYIINSNYYTNSDFHQGPISSNYSNYQYQGRWNNNVWKISQKEIDQFKALWMCNQGLIDNGCDTISPLSSSTLNTINTWPANGDTSVGESQQLAPYFDRNDNGIYEPNLGDYPLIKGMSAVYFIQNDDDPNLPFGSSNERLGLEMHTMIYQFSSFDEINDATFIDISIFNRSERNYHDFVFGGMMDADVGNYSDDYYGCDSASNLMYFYNGDAYDQTDGGRLGYGYNPPAIGITALNHTMNVSLAFLSTAIYPDIDTNLLNISTFSPKQIKWFKFLGLKSDGSSFLNPSNSPTTHYYSGNPIQLGSWNEITDNNPTGDRKGFFAAKPVDFPSGASLVYSYGLVYERSSGQLENVNQLIENIPFYKNAFDSNFVNYYQETGYSMLEENNVVFNSFPNPSNSIYSIFLDEVNSQNATCQIMSFDGTSLAQYSLESGQNNLNLEQFQTGTYNLILHLNGVRYCKKLIIIR